MTLSRTLFAAFISAGATATVQGHDLGDSGTHFHMAESQGLAAAFPDHPWLVLTMSLSFMVTGLVLRRWKRS
ncbi:MAG: hypothetical protein QGF18_03360 [Alphaproteobacteria bacterium]|nr:hypothetical protein [Alphaproteobacteria bacterium]MDP7190948.1 hypothetical protein [Alphaproteobacteria bacterium]MDP7456619.1 hypothetical protein [Alphaproteobacteria bacterium]HJO88668.1 hypothetical protein [Alphaproteobacteria bacterium]